jgi:hypothetical protein
MDIIHHGNNPTLLGASGILQRALQCQQTSTTPIIAATCRAFITTFVESSELFHPSPCQTEVVNYGDVLPHPDALTALKGN